MSRSDRRARERIFLLGIVVLADDGIDEAIEKAASVSRFDEAVDGFRKRRQGRNKRKAYRRKVRANGRPCGWGR